MVTAKPTAKPMSSALEFKEVCFDYGELRALSHINFTLNPGNCVALVGASGSGKSTLARLVARFEDPTQGRVMLGGVDLRSVSTEDLYAHVSFVFQDVFLFAETVAENIRLGRPSATADEVIAAAQAAQAHEFISRLPNGYETTLSVSGRGLSGGERRGLLIARAILKNPPILLLDEATAFADPENEALIQQAIRRLTAGRSVIVIAHRLQTIVHADEILVLAAGRIIERGRHDTLLAAKGS